MRKKVNDHRWLPLCGQSFLHSVSVQILMEASEKESERISPPAGAGVFGGGGCCLSSASGG